MHEFSKPVVHTLRESTVPGMAAYDSQQDTVHTDAGTAVELVGGGSFSTMTTKNFQNADLESAATSQRTEFFELSP